MKSVFSKVVTIWLTIVLLIGAVVGVNVFAAATEVATVDYKNVSYDGQIQLVYYVKTSVADAADGSYVKLRFWWPGIVPADANTEGYEEKGSTLTTTIKGVDYSLYFSGGILPKMMRDDIYACTVRYDKDGNVLTTGELFKFSIREYVELRLAAGSTDAQIELYMSLLNYGSAVQQALGYNTDKLADRFYDFDGYTASEVSGKTTDVTVYYDPATGAYTNASTGAEGEVTYTVTFVSGGTVLWDEANAAFTMEKKHEITKIVASDGSDTITLGDVTYEVGDLVPYRNWLTTATNDNTSNNPRLFAGERPTITIGNLDTRPTLESDLLYVFESTFVAERYSSGIGNIVYLHLMNSEGKSAATTVIQHHWNDKVYYNAMTAGDAVPSATGLVTALGDRVDVRIEVRRVDEENVSVCLIANGTVTAPVTVPAFELAGIKFVMQDDGRDRNATVKMTNTNFIKYTEAKVEETNPYEPNTDQLPNVDVPGTVGTATIWGKDGTYYKTATDGATEYKVSFKTGYSAVVNSNGSVTYFTGGEITAIKTADGTDVPYLTYGGVNYGVGDVIPNRAFFISTDLNTDRVFVIDMTMLSASTEVVKVEEDTVNTDLLMLLETDLTVDAGHLVDGDYVALINLKDTNGTDATMRVLMSTDAGKPVTRLSSFSSIYASSNTAVEVGKTFKLRIEVRENADGKYDYIVKLNGNVVSTTVRDYAPTGAFTIGRLWDDQTRRYNAMTFRNFKAISYEYPNPFEPNTNQFVPVAANIKTVSIWGKDGVYTASATEGATEYKISFKNNTSAVVNADGSVTLDNYATITAIKTADGADTTIAYNGATYGVGDVIPYRCFFISTDPGSSGNGTQFAVTSPMFTISADKMNVRSDATGFDFDLVTLLETELSLESIASGTYTEVISLDFKDTAGTAKSMKIIKSGGSVYVTKFGGGIYDVISTGAKLGDTFKLRIEVRKNGTQYDYVTYVNGAQVCISTHDNALDGSLTAPFRNDVTDRSHRLTLGNFKFITYEVLKVAVPSELEQNTTGLATADKTSGTSDTTIYYNSSTGAYSTAAADGYAPYVVTWKNGFDVVVNPDGSVTYVKAATIVSIKDEGGNEATLPYSGKTYGAGDLIPRNNWFVSTSFDQRFDGVRYFETSESNVTFIGNRYADTLDATSDKVDTTLHYVLETELTLEKLSDDSAKAGIVQIINQTTTGGTGLNIILGRNADDTIYIEAGGSTKTVDARLGESFTYRMEVRKNGSAFDVTIYVNGFAVIEYTYSSAELRTQVRFVGYNYSASRNHSVTFNNFRHIAWNITDAQ